MQEEIVFTKIKRYILRPKRIIIIKKKVVIPKKIEIGKIPKKNIKIYIKRNRNLIKRLARL